MVADFNIENCNWSVAFQCPKRWEALDATDDPNVRGCPVCLRSVHFCSSEAEVRQCVAEGKCVAIMEPDDGEFLGILEAIGDD